MKKTISSLLMLCLLFSLNAFAGLYVEQQISSTDPESKGKKIPIKMYMSKHGMKFYGGFGEGKGKKNPMGGGYMIMTAKGKMFNVMPQSRMYMDMDEMMKNAQMYQPNKGRTKPPKVSYKKVGKTKKLGRSCMMFTAKVDNKTDGQFCMINMTSMGISSSEAERIDKMFMSFNDEVNKNNPGANSYDYRSLRKAMGGPSFPLWSQFKSGKATTIMATTKFKSRKMAASEFRVPKGYNRFQMPVFNPGGGMDPKQLEALKKQMEQMKKSGK